MTCSELEAARDHLRARLHQQIEDWQEMHAAIERSIDIAQSNAVLYYGNGQRCTLQQCIADLLAVLTEPQQHEMHEKTNKNAVTRSAETDVIRDVAKEMRFLVSSPDVEEDVVTLKHALRRRLLAWAERLSPLKDRENRPRNADPPPPPENVKMRKGFG